MTSACTQVRDFINLDIKKSPPVLFFCWKAVLRSKSKDFLDKCLGADSHWTITNSNHTDNDVMISYFLVRRFAEPILRCHFLNLSLVCQRCINISSISYLFVYSMSVIYMCFWQIQMHILSKVKRQRNMVLYSIWHALTFVCTSHSRSALSMVKSRASYKQ